MHAHKKIQWKKENIHKKSNKVNVQTYKKQNWKKTMHRGLLSYASKPE